VFLERSILSVLNQTYDNIEYIIIDGGSNDSTLDIIKKYEDYIDYYVSEPDGGIYYALNKGLCLASGDYITILNSDDFYFTNSIEECVSKVLNNAIDYIVSGSIKINDDYSIKEKYIPTKKTESSIFNYNIATKEVWFIKSSCYNSVGYYDVSYKLASDYKFKTELFPNNFKYLISDSPLLSTNNDILNKYTKTDYLEEVYSVAMNINNIYIVSMT